MPTRAEVLDDDMIERVIAHARCKHGRYWAPEIREALIAEREEPEEQTTTIMVEVYEDPRRFAHFETSMKFGLERGSVAIKSVKVVK